MTSEKLWIKSFRPPPWSSDRNVQRTLVLFAQSEDQATHLWTEPTRDVDHRFQNFRSRWNAVLSFLEANTTSGT